MAQPISLADLAVESLNIASAAQSAEAAATGSERSVWRPDSWLLQRCWQALADVGAGRDALTVAALAEIRRPLSPSHALYRIAKQVEKSPQLVPLVRAELAQLHEKLFNPNIVSDPTRQIDRLLYCAASAAKIDDAPLAFACLERLDQLPKGWDRVFVLPETRQLLADTVAQLGLHPLTTQLITTSIRQYGDSGAQFLQQIAEAVAAEACSVTTDKLLHKAVETLQNALLTSLHSRRITAILLAQTGLVDDMLAQLRTIATIQDAHRETDSHIRSGSSQYAGQYAGTLYSSGSRDSYGGRTMGDSLIRQVTRVHADHDVDFLVYTLRNAIDVLPAQGVSNGHRVALANLLADLGVRSDGWTAAGAISTLVKLDSMHLAFDVLEQISPTDPTRSEGYLALVDALLTRGDEQTAAEQTQLAIQWANALEERTPLRATIWGLTEIYLDHHAPRQALQLLGPPPEPTWGERLRRLLQGQFFHVDVSDEELRTDRLRVRGLLQLEQQDLHPYTEVDDMPAAAKPSPDLDAETDSLVKRLGQWAPRLLEGEALLGFYVDGLLKPLLAAGKTRHAWGLLPRIKETILSLRGAKHADNLTEIMALFAAEIDPQSPNYQPDTIDAMRRLLEEFLVTLWQENAKQGIWQAVYGIEGTLPLLMALEGPQAVVEVARSVADEGALWLQ